MKGLKPSFSVVPWPLNNGGPQVMMRRFIGSARLRRYTVLPEWLTDKRQPCLLNIGHRHQGELFSSGRHITYRVAGFFIRDVFERLAAIYGDRAFRPEFEQANEGIRRALERATFVIYQSHWSKAKLDTLHRRSEGTWRVIPNAVNLSAFKPSADWPRVANRVPVIGAVGSMRYRPRLEILFDVANRLPVRPQILLVGDMDSFCQTTLARALDDPRWHSLIEHVPAVSPERLVEFYQRIDCLVHTVAGDSCPNVVVEALACGVPVVCPEEGGTAELVGAAGVSVPDQEGTYGESLRVGMAEGVMRVLSDLPSYQQLARRQAENSNDIEILTPMYLDALGFPPYAHERGWKYNVVRQVGNLGRLIPRARLTPTTRPGIGLILWDWNLGGISSWMFRVAKALPEFKFHFIATHLNVHAPQCEELGVFAYTPGFVPLWSYLRHQGIHLVQVNNNRWPVDAAKAAGVHAIVERIAGTRSCCAVSKDDVDLVILSSKGYVPYVCRFWPNVQFEVIRNGIDLGEIDIAEARRLAPEGSISIGCCTRFGKGKRLDLIIDSILKLQEAGLKVHLTLAGEDSRLDGAVAVSRELRDRASRLGNNVAFTGRVNDPIPITLGFDIGVSASNDEGIANSVIEPMACRKPVVSTRVGQMAELVKDGVNGFLVPPRDVQALAGALERLVRDPALRYRMGEEARRTVATKFAFDEGISRYRAIYRRLLQNV
jgi:glycosyltransferase involved in cell wall biosynthesis